VGFCISGTERSGSAALTCSGTLSIPWCSSKGRSVIVGSRAFTKRHELQR
jgi:hypothetical protein